MEARIETNAVLQKEVALGFVVEAVTLLQEIETSKLRMFGMNLEPIALTKARLKLVRAMQVLDEGELSEQTRRTADSVELPNDSGAHPLSLDPISVQERSESDAKKDLEPCPRCAGGLTHYERHNNTHCWHCKEPFPLSSAATEEGKS